MKDALLYVGLGAVVIIVFHKWRPRNPQATMQTVFNGGVAGTSGGGANEMRLAVPGFAPPTAAGACNDCASGASTDLVIGTDADRVRAMPVKIDSPDAIFWAM